MPMEESPAACAAGFQFAHLYDNGQSLTNAIRYLAAAKAILEFLTNCKEARRTGEEGRRIACECFDERLVFKKVKAEYERLL